MAPLSQRNHNSMAKSDGKRKRDEVDLTISDDEVQHTKSRKNAHQPSENRSQSSGSQSRPSLPTPPTSSAPGGGYQSVYGAPSSSFYQTDDRVTRDSWLSQAEGGDANEIITPSQDDADTSELTYHYGDLPTKIVGVQYYKGLANPGEQILMRREPGNPYDSNAIRIDNVGHTQIGHIPRTMAAKIAKYIDNRWLSMEGQLAGNKGFYDCPLTVHMYGPDPNSETGQMIRQHMIADKLPTKALQEAERRRKQEEKERLAAARAAAAAAKANKGKGKYTNQNIPDSSQPLDMDSLLESSQRINPREIGDAADKLGYSEDELKNMPMADKPAAIKTNMLPYQLQALEWLLDQESPPEPGSKPADSVQLWTKAKNCFTNLATNHSQAESPKLASGGILADDMGLGKTLEMISLIIADIEKFGRGPTLIVAPVSVMSNWSDQIAHHVEESSMLQVYTYHGSGRVKMKAEDFEQYDVVLTSYQTLANDYMPGGKGSKEPERKLRSTGPYSVNWRRVILDEGHVIRNHKTKVALAACALMTRSRWALTGTPIVNTIKDLYSLLRFIGITGGMQQLQIFNTVLGRPLATNDPDAQVLLQLIMKAFTLRRRKDMAYIDLRLPKLDEFVHHVEFSDKERERYEALRTEAKGLVNRFDKSAQAGDAKKDSPTYNHILEILLRMRQCCNHWQLCGERVTNLLKELEQSKVVSLTPENKKALQDILQVQIDSQEDCSVCLETLHNPVITTCGHPFGRECISKVIELQHKCPFCRAELKDEGVLVEPKVEAEEERSNDDELDLTQSSSKTDALMQILDAIKGDGNKQDKTIIFSQWTRFLDIIEPRVDQAGLKYCRLDGSMPARKRDAALKTLEEDPETTIMLASLSVCAVGLNLTAANNVILADTWWAPAIEDQAIDRVHRLGQKKETRVFRLVVDNSVELTTLDIQQEKRKLMKLAFSEKKSKRDDVRAGRMADIRKLLA